MLDVGTHTPPVMQLLPGIARPAPFPQRNHGVRPWLPEVIVEPGWISVVARLPTRYAPQGPVCRVCWRCVPGLLERHEGHAAVAWEENPSTPDARCPRCERPFGHRATP